MNDYSVVNEQTWRAKKRVTSKHHTSHKTQNSGICLHNNDFTKLKVASLPPECKWELAIWISPKCFHWIRVIQCQKFCHYGKRAQTSHPATSCVSDQDITKVPAWHMWETGSLNWTLFILYWFIRFLEFATMSRSLLPYFERRSKQYMYVDQNGPTPMLAVKRSAGVAPEVTHCSQAEVIRSSKQRPQNFFTKCQKVRTDK